MNLLPTASKTALWFLCAYFARADVPVDPDRPNPYRNWGLAHHDALEVLQHGGELDLKAIADARELTPAQRLALPRSIETLKAIDAPKHAISEIAFALDLDTGEARELGRRIGRTYVEHGAREGIDICGTPDLAWMCPEESLRGYVRIVDLKSGWEGRVIDHIDQLMTCAALVCRAWMARGAMLTILHVIDGEVREDNVLVEDYELHAHIARLQARRRETPDAQPNPGVHCRKRYCTAIASCPEGQRVVSAIIPADRLAAAKGVKLAGEIESEEEGLLRIRLLPLLKERTKRYEEDCEAWALKQDGGGVRLPDGTYYGRKESGAREIRATPKALEVLREEIGGDGVSRICAVQNITQAAIKRELQTLGVSSVGDVLDEIMKKLDKVGAIEKRDKESVGFQKRPTFVKTKQPAEPPARRVKQSAAPQAAALAVDDEGPL